MRFYLHKVKNIHFLVAVDFAVYLFGDPNRICAKYGLEPEEPPLNDTILVEALIRRVGYFCLL